ncbi:helix-turn-helix domain-containing protein [Streptomyces tagetis]|uniref:DUF2690 domain-containing protein n=1 Tax=Streptomyces tagetis TaxID=2820809 RepID=A0A940XHM0_9ACTN|nr:XRE family transcriptional regulator [Streptomyces sp. RG38]MBQ0828574.1 DUF2690 domain-containing protein [Streptomyces sp. RG38]
MPRWKALPDELDPQIKEFANQLRRLVDRSDLSIASVADATGYSKTSWERYLNGRLLAPKGAIVALAEVTGTNPVHLTTMWELAERAWSRSEMRHDMTMEAIRISQARAALGELDAPADSGSRRANRAGRHAGGTAARGGAPTVPVQPTAADSADAGLGAVRTGAADGNSWNMAGYRGPAPTGHRAARGPRGAGVPAGPGGAAPAGHGGPGAGGTGRRGSGGGKRTATFVMGAVGVLVVTAGAFFLLSGGDGKDAVAQPSPSPSVTKKELPPGVKCSGAACTGQDAEAMGCGGDLVTTATTTTVGTAVVEVRYSEVCETAWGRVTQAAQGDEVRVSAGGEDPQTGAVNVPGDTVAYTPMVAVQAPEDAIACVTLATGEKGCTQ